MGMYVGWENKTQSEQKESEKEKYLQDYVTGTQNVYLHLVFGKSEEQNMQSILDLIICLFLGKDFFSERMLKFHKTILSVARWYEIYSQVDIRYFK